MLETNQLKEEELSKVTGGTTDEHGDNYSLLIKSYTCSKETVAKLLKEITRVGYKEAKELVDSIPMVILNNLSYEEGQKIINKLTQNSIVAEIMKD